MEMAGYGEILEDTAKPGSDAGDWATEGGTAASQGVETYGDPSRHKDAATDNWVRDDQSQPQLPAPPELKLLRHGFKFLDQKSDSCPQSQNHQDKGKRPWTADELRLALQGEDPVRAKFSKPIPYPKVNWP